MTETQAATALATTLLLGGIWYLVFFPFHDLAIDEFRQRMFANRDRLFDLAADGALAFDHPAYVHLRATMNGFIRFAHRISLPLVLVRVAGGGFPKARSVDWKALLADLPPGVRKELVDIKDRMHVLLTIHLVTGSPIVSATIIAPVLIVVLARHRAATMLRYARRLEAVDIDVERAITA